MTDGIASGRIQGGGIASDMAGMMMGINIAGQVMQNLNLDNLNQPNNQSNNQVNNQTNNQTNNQFATGGKKPNFCPNCGQKTSDANFCPNCGQKLI